MNPTRLPLILFAHRRRIDNARIRLNRLCWLLGFILVVSAAVMPSSPMVQAQGRALITPDNASRVTQVAALGYGYSTDVAWSLDGKTLAVGARAGVLVYDATALEIAPHLQKVSIGSVNGVAFSPNGKMLAIGGHDGIVLWDRANGQERIISQAETNNEVLTVAFSPDGKVVAAGSSGDTVRLWDVATGRQLAALKGYDKAVTTIAFSPDGQVLAASGGYDDGMIYNDGTVRLWNITTGKLLAALGGRDDRLSGVAFSPDGLTLATGSYDNTVRLWDVATGKQRAALKGHTGDVVSVAFSPDGKTLASSAGWEESAVRLWDAATGKLRATLNGCTRGAHMGEMGKVVFSPDGATLASTCSDSGVMLWDVATGQSHLVSQGYSSPIYSVTFSPDGSTLATGGGWMAGSVRLWDMAAGTERAIPSGHTGWVRSVAFSPDGKILASGSGDGTVRLWNTATGKRLRTIEGSSSAVSGIVSGSDEDGDVTFKLEASSNAVWSVAFSPDGKLLAVGRGDPWVGPGSFQLWNLVTGELLANVEPRHDRNASMAVSTYNLAFSPDGTLLATVNGDGVIRLWDVATYQARATLHGHTAWVGSVAFSPDGTMLASGGVWSNCDYGMVCRTENDHGEIRLWDVLSGEQTALLEGHIGGVSGVAFSHDGRIVASGGEFDGIIRLWDVNTHTVLAALKGYRISSLAFSPDGTLLASSGEDGIVRLWAVAER